MTREVYLTTQKIIFEDEATARDSEKFHDLIAELEQKGFNKPQIILFLGVVNNSDFAYSLLDYTGGSESLDYLLEGDEF